MVHILNGDFLAEQLKQTKINHDFIVFRESLVEGVVNAKSIDEFRAIRSKFVAETYNVPEEEYFNRSVSEFEKINQLPGDSEVCLWFENDLFCQVNMWFILSILSDHPEYKVFRVFPVIENNADIWQGFGISGAEKLEQAYNSRIQFNQPDIQLGKDLWKAYQFGDLNKLTELSRTESKCFEYLEEVCQAHIDRFPTEGAVGRPDKAIKDIIENISSDFQTVVSEFTKREGIYGFGDMQIRGIYRKYSDFQPPPVLPLPGEG